MKTNQLNNEAREVLLAILKDGAKTHKPHSTTVENIVLLLNWDVGGKSNDKIREVLHELLTNGYSIQNGKSFALGSYLSSYEISDHGNLTITVNIPESLAQTIVNSNT
ncbi:hypothetical protein [Methylotenera sp.]|uniref:hypothetical protein n=1 Tax=Methylotenera sp. TaxID=2051956 RepID=UPI002ED7D6F1